MKELKGELIELTLDGVPFGTSPEIREMFEHQSYSGEFFLETTDEVGENFQEFIRQICTFERRLSTYYQVWMHAIDHCPDMIDIWEMVPAGVTVEFIKCPPSP